MALDVEVDVLQPFLYIKARTGFLYPRQVSVTYDLGVRIVETKLLEQVLERGFLGGSAGIGRIAVGIKSTFVADADAVGVVTLGMGAYLLLRTTGIEHAILGDVIMVADGSETSSLMTGFEGFYRKVLRHSGGRTVDDD